MWSIPLGKLVQSLKERGACRVVLQFPDGLKRKAFSTAIGLKEAGFEVTISGDPCYGACDLAVSALEKGSVLVHFGHAPIEERDDVIYEPLQLDIDPAMLEGALPLLTSRRIGLVTTVQHAHMVDEMARYLKTRGVEAVVRSGGSRAPLKGQILGCSFAAARETGADEILYVGTGVFHALGVQLATGARVVALDPYSGTAESVDASRMLRKRFALIEKARDAASFGILLSTKTGQERGDLARHLESLSSRACIIALSEVTPDALLNLGFECYVNTACPRLAYDDQARFPAPLLSPPEFEILCGVRSWDAYLIDEIA